MDGIEARIIAQLARALADEAQARQRAQRAMDEMRRDLIETERELEAAYTALDLGITLGEARERIGWQSKEKGK